MQRRTWPMRLAFVALGLVVVFFHLLPLETVPRQWAPPDVLLAFTFAWVLRRPDYVPVVLVAGVFLLVDLLLQRPPGLYAALVVLGCDFLKSRANGMSEASFLGEWATVAIVLSGVMLLYRTALGLVVLQDPPLTLTLTQLLLTIAIYPLAVVISQSAMRVRKPTPADSNAMGARK
ncbi:rod shape-determining protein MreD [Marinibacterium profundimaris]|uniref:Membrane protein n=1 Tax=Marinibacterium profundimaris TaxID=1679460 RepID=A0A225NHR6_9RHOB|nr:rod shape-determining protein MreD [Marinibacterium profundimaris]OWU73283.1 membrane protein [Marinibacterium profundimaris]